MIRPVTPAELSAMIAENPGIDLVDVRDPEEWITGHVAGARLVPLAELRSDPEQHLVRGSTIVFMCAKGVRGLQAAKLADRLGYEPSCNLEGGVTESARTGFALSHTPPAA